MSLYHYVTDNPGAKTVIVRRGTKRVENVSEYSKVAISIMVFEWWFVNVFIQQLRHHIMSLLSS